MISFKGMPAPAPIRLSKLPFVAGVQCLKRLYLQVYHPELADEADEGQEARLEQGNEVGFLAQRRFPGGVVVGLSEGLDAALAKTASLLDDASAPAIFEATFQHQGVLVGADIFQRRPRNRWRLIEVKSSVEVKEYYSYYVAIQSHVVVACGLDLSSSCLMHLNRDYIFDGHHYDAAVLFNIRNITSEVRKLDNDLPKLLKVQRKALAQTREPEVSPGRQCYEPYGCEFFDHCSRPSRRTTLPSSRG